jgi:predicted HicB family RNase H-like nuclease
MMEYKGYTGQITTVDENQGLFHGRVDGLIDVITFEGRTPEEIVQAFRDSVDDYLDFCRMEKEPPEKPFSGKFLVRIPADLHKRAALAAKKCGNSLNSWVASAIKAQIEKEKSTPMRDIYEAEHEEIKAKTPKRQIILDD